MGRAVEIEVSHGVSFSCKKQWAVVELDSPMSSYHFLVNE